MKQADNQRPSLVLINYSGIGDLLISLECISGLRDHYRVLPFIQKGQEKLAQTLMDDGIIEDYLYLGCSIRFRNDPLGHLTIVNALNRLKPDVILIYGKTLLAVLTLIGLIKAKTKLICLPLLPSIFPLKPLGLIAPTHNRAGDFKLFSERLRNTTQLPTVRLSSAGKHKLLRHIEHINLPKRYVVIAPWTSNPKRDAPLSSFKRCIKIISHEHNLPIILTGPMQFQSVAEELVLEYSDLSITNLVGKTSIKTLLGLIDNTSFLLSNDSGNMHIAILLNTPSLIFFNSKTKEQILKHKKNNNVSQLFCPSLIKNDTSNEFTQHIEWKKTRQIIADACLHTEGNQ